MSIQEPLYLFISNLVGERALAEDILQEVFILIYRKLRWLREPGLFRPWAFRIASREAFRHLKRDRRWSEQMAEESALKAIPALEREEIFDPELVAQLPQLMARVSPASRAVLILHYQHEMPLAEVAEVLGIAVGTVKSRLAYGLDNLRRTVAEKCNQAQMSSLNSEEDCDVRS